MNTVKEKPYLTGILGSSTALILFLLLTNPNQLPIILLVVPILLGFIILFCLATVTLARTRFLATQPIKRRAVAVIISSLMTVVLILQSSGGISGADALLLALIVIVLSIYVSKF